MWTSYDRLRCPLVSLEACCRQVTVTAGVALPGGIGLIELSMVQRRPLNPHPREFGPL